MSFYLIFCTSDNFCCDFINKKCPVWLRCCSKIPSPEIGMVPHWCHQYVHIFYTDDSLVISVVHVFLWIKTCINTSTSYESMVACWTDFANIGSTLAPCSLLVTWLADFATLLWLAKNYSGCISLYFSNVGPMLGQWGIFILDGGKL